ncbi:MAG: PIN domain nuclease [Ilumatobacteraceae bacterium]
MALTHLVDTSVLKRLSTQAVRDVIEPLADSGRLARTTISDLEVGYSARNSREWDDLLAALEIFAMIETTAQHFDRAKQVQRLLAARSQRGRKIPDLLIAAAAEAERLTVLHYDQDFDMIAEVTGQRCQWVASAGTID